MAKLATLGMRRFAHLLRTMRARDGLSQRELAGKLECSQANIAKIEALAGGTVGLDLVERATKLFGLDPQYFFVPGRDEIDPSEYKTSGRKTLEGRIHALELQLEAENAPGSGPRNIRKRRHS